MKHWSLLVTVGVVGFAGLASLTAFTAVEACNSGNGDCPDKVAVVAGASCSDDNLQCAFDLTTPAVACDGTSSVVATSCTCTHGHWSCPSAFECEGGADGGDGGDGEASTDDGGGDDSGDSGGDAGDSGDSSDARG